MLPPSECGFCHIFSFKPAGEWREGSEPGPSKHFWHANLDFWSVPCCFRKRSPTAKWKGHRDIHMHSTFPPSGFRWLGVGWFGLSWRIETWEPFVSTPFWVKCYIFHLKISSKKKNMVWKEDTIWKPSHLSESLLNVTLGPVNSFLN